MLFLASWWREILIAALVAACALLFHEWQAQVKETGIVQGKYDAFVNQTDTIGKEAIAAKDKEIAHHKEVIKNVAASYETDIDAIHAHYAAKLRDEQQSSGGSSVPAAGTSDAGHDAAAAQPTTCGQGVEENAVLDARELIAWHQWATQNGIPVQQ